MATLTDSLLNGLKSLFSGLGAKTTDSNYAVPLVNKSNAEPAGYMEMSNLATLMAGVKPLANQNLDSVFQNGTYFVGSGNEGKPNTNDGFFVVLNYNNASITQIYWCTQPSNGVYIRNTINQGSSWRGWYKINTTSV